jgi:hypothetical protein
MQPARLSSSFVARLLLRPIPTDRAPRTLPKRCWINAFPLDVSARVLHAGRRADFASPASSDLARSIRELIEPTHL